MKKNYARKVIAIVIAGVIIGFGVNAFAGNGYGRMGWSGPQGQGPGSGPCWGAGYAANLSEADIQKLQEQRKAFFEATADLRQEMRQKRLALRAEMAKKSPDIAVAKNLQTEISNLQAELAQKRLEHIMEMKKINPNAGGRWMGAGPMGFGPGQGRGWHHGPGYGRGYGMGGSGSY